MSTKKDQTKNPRVILHRPVEIVSHDGAISLHQLIPSDTQELFELIDRNRDHLSQFGDDTANKYPTVDALRESIERPRNRRRMRFAIRNIQDQIVGSINLTPDEDNPEQGEIGYYLGKEFEKKGFAGRAVERLTEYGFGELGYKTLYGEVVVGNDGSINVLQRAGYTETGRHDDKITLTKQK